MLQMGTVGAKTFLYCWGCWAEKKYYADRKLLQKYFCVMGGKLGKNPPLLLGLRLGYDKAETGNRACEGVTGLASASALFNYARLNFSFGCLQRGQRQSAGRSSNATPSCSAGSYT